MRLRRASASYGTLDKRVRFSQETVLVAAMAVVGIWVVGSLAQGVSLSQSLSRQASDLRQQNAALQAANDSYQRDIAAAASGAGAEEEARRSGYARRDEKLYIISTPPPPTPAPKPRPKAGRPGSGGPLDGIWRLLTGR